MTIKLDNCNFEFLCEQRWDELSETGEQDVRFCNKCQRNVYFCDDRDKIDHAIRLNRCVAIDSEVEIQGRSGRLIGWVSM
jgi:hypothetical protein